jgi:predicted alpha-1,2-mannosidase
MHPSRKDQLDDQIDYFPLNVASHRIASVFSFMPVRGLPNEEIWRKRTTYDHEINKPHYYRGDFEDPGLSFIEFTPSHRSGYFRIKFKGNHDRYLRLGTINNNGEISVLGKKVITGIENFSGMKAYFYAEINTNINSVRYLKEDDNNNLLAKISDDKEIVDFKYGISYISIDQAKKNLHMEIQDWNFNKIKRNAFRAWDEVLSRIEVAGGTDAQKRVFYTALYRSYERMVDINEYGRYYSAFDDKVHQSEEPFFVDNWIWDNYIALEPLHMILDPDQGAERIRSYISMYEQSGWMPSFAVIFGDWPAMTGNHAATWMADAWFKGITNFDLSKAYEGLRKNSLNATLLPWNNGPPTVLDDFYNENGYMPGLAPGEEETVKEVDTVWEKRQAVSVTIENSYSDWNIAQLARKLGKEKDKNLFIDRAGNYKNVYRTEKGFMWPKDSNGNWIEPFDPKLAGREYFTENNAYTYNWSVKHDLEGLFELMGGRKAAESKLDQLFREELGAPKFIFWRTQPDASGLVGQFVMGNEPSFHIPYLYNYLGAPWKTQERIRMLLDTWFRDDVFGIPGDEDGGGMSSYVVFSMMGFFQVTPGIPTYSIGSPVFNKISIALPEGGEFTIIAKNNSAKNKYIQKASLNGSELDKPWFTHEDLISGGELELLMGEEPNKQWGSKPTDAPPSAIDYQPIQN